WNIPPVIYILTALIINKLNYDYVNIITNKFTEDCLKCTNISEVLNSESSYLTLEFS
ncbi:13716_t:CDS:2, partial [Dentiscutata heterogama]